MNQEPTVSKELPFWEIMSKSVNTSKYEGLHKTHRAQDEYYHVPQVS